MAKSLTDRQREVLAFLQGYYGRYGIMPTFREISQAFGWKCITAAVCHLKVLEQKGYLTRGFRKARSLRLTELATGPAVDWQTEAEHWKARALTAEEELERLQSEVECTPS